MCSFGIAMITYSYAGGFLFKKVKSAEKFFSIINFFIMYSIPYIFSLVTKGTLNTVLYCLFYMISPFFMLDKCNF